MNVILCKNCKAGCKDSAARCNACGRSLSEIALSSKINDTKAPATSPINKPSTIRPAPKNFAVPPSSDNRPKPKPTSVPKDPKFTTLRNEVKKWEDITKNTSPSTVEFPVQTRPGPSHSVWTPPKTSLLDFNEPQKNSTSRIADALISPEKLRPRGQTISSERKEINPTPSKLSSSPNKSNDPTPQKSSETIIPLKQEEPISSPPPSYPPPPRPNTPSAQSRRKPSRPEPNQSYIHSSSDTSQKEHKDHEYLSPFFSSFDACPFCAKSIEEFKNREKVVVLGKEWHRTCWIDKSKIMLAETSSQHPREEKKSNPMETSKPSSSTPTSASSPVNTPFPIVSPPMNIRTSKDEHKPMPQFPPPQPPQIPQYSQPLQISQSPQAPYRRERDEHPRVEFLEPVATPKSGMKAFFLRKKEKKEIKKKLKQEMKEKKEKQKKKKKLKTFGSDLQDILEVEERNTFVPLIVEKCVEYLDKEGLEVEGIFRVSPRLSEMIQLAKLLDDGTEIDFHKYTRDVHLIAGILKKWFRELPDPLLTFELYDCFIAIEAIKDENVRLYKWRDIMKMLPDCNAILVEYMLDYLDRVARHANKNKMTVTNLATIFGPIFLRSEVLFQEVIAETSAVCGIVCELIQKRLFLFGELPKSV